MRHSLRSRFYLIVIGIATVPILVLGLIAGQRSADELERQSLSLQRELALRVEREIASFVQMRLNELRILERTNLLVTMGDSALTATLSRLLAHDQVYQTLMVLEVDGRIRVSVSRTAVALAGTKFGSGLPITAPAFWHGEHQYVGPVEYDAQLREPLLNIAIPIVNRRSGKAARVLLARVRFKRIWDLLANLGLPGATEAFVVNAEGRILAHRSAAKVLAQSFLDLPAHSGRHSSASGQPGLVAMQALSLVGEPAYVVVTRPLEAALAIAAANRDATLATTMVLLLLAALVALLLSRQIVGPIETLSATARRIASGDLNATIELSGPTEIHALGHSLQDMTNRLKGIIANLEHSEYAERQRAMVTLESIGDAVITTDAKGKVTYLNPVAESMTGWSQEDAAGEPITAVLHIINEQTRAPAPDPIGRCLAEGRVLGLANHTVLLSRDGSEYAIQNSAAPIRERDGDLLGVVLVFSDVTDARQLQREIMHQATHDSLTSLVNRREFEHRLDRVLETVHDDSSEHALCYLDLDQFKVINDTCGHTAGDELLCEIAVLLQQKIRHRDTLARLGGDEFAVLMEHCNLDDAQRVAEALRSAVEKLRFSWENHTFTVGVSIGLVPITRSSDSVTAVLRAADNACYVAKDGGRNRVHVYRDDDVHLARRRDEMQWVGTLTQALEERRFELHVQKIVEIGGRDRAGISPGLEHYEVLLRLVNANGERILPGVFLPAAERYNLITRIDRWVIEQAFEWLAQRASNAKPVLCAINISGASIGEEAFLDYVLQHLDEPGVVGEQVCFEITETAAIGNLVMATRFIHALRQHGCCFALDDFGSGLSSFAYLKTLPVQFLKIDGVFVKDIAVDPLDLAMVRSINDVGQLLGMRTIAEFVETQEVLDKLCELGVDAAQGYHFGWPEPLLAVESRCTP